MGVIESGNIIVHSMLRMDYISRHNPISPRPCTSLGRMSELSQVSCNRAWSKRSVWPARMFEVVHNFMIHGSQFTVLFRQVGHVTFSKQKNNKNLGGHSSTTTEHNSPKSTQNTPDRLGEPLVCWPSSRQQHFGTSEFRRLAAVCQRKERRKTKQPLLQGTSFRLRGLMVCPGNV